MIAVLADFAPRFLLGFLVNVEIALSAVAAGLLLGTPMALARLRVPGLRRALRLLTMLMQAAPVYVIMFFVLNLFPQRIAVFGAPVAIGGIAAVILSQSVNMAAYMSEVVEEAARHWHAGQRDQALLLVPAVLRGFFIVLMSSGFGAAIGVVEAVGVTLRQAQLLPHLRDRILLFLVVMAFFVAVLGAANLLVHWLVRRLKARGRAVPRPLAGGELSERGAD